MPDPPLKVARRVVGHGAIEIWTLNRPERANALSRDLVSALKENLDRLYAGAGVRALIVTGEGGRVFCAGADLKERRTMSTVDVGVFLDALGQALWRLDRAPWPVIAAIDGLALGGGLELALACDFRIASKTAALALPETSLGIIPGAGGTQRLTRLVGEAAAKRIILCAERMDADHAARLGLVHEVVETSAIEPAIALAERLASGAPIAITAALEAIDAALSTPLEEGLAIERRCYERTLESEDRKEALEAFAAKRRPVFRGR